MSGIFYSRKSEQGFTLVELAISLTIIGLLMVAFLKSQEILTNARANSLMRQIKSFDAGVNLFMDNYGFLPGDIRDPANTVIDCLSPICSLGGNGDRIIRNLPASGTVTQPEEYNFFVHLSRSGVIPDEVPGTTTVALAASNPELVKPKTIYDQLISIEALGDDRPVYTIEMMPPKVMYQVDMKLDNGKPDNNLTGLDVPRRVFVKGGACPLSSDSLEYDLTSYSTTSMSCRLFITADF